MKIRKRAKDNKDKLSIEEIDKALERVFNEYPIGLHEFKAIPRVKKEELSKRLSKVLQE